jgi:ubiquinone/menaquinone biosynthesis C-methylase UbiE
MGRMADIDEVMYSCGLEILHPGGIEKTDELATMCGIAKDKEVLDIGCGKGTTACYLAEKYGCRVVGLDCSERMVEYSRAKAREKGLEERVRFEVGDALKLPFADESFDIVLAECTTTLLDKEKAFAEFLRVTRRGGWIGDSEMTWQAPPPEALVKKLYDLWEGFGTMTLAEWKAFLEKKGLAEVQTADFSRTIDDMEKSMKAGLGYRGMAKMCMKLLVRSDLRRAMGEYRKLAKEYRGYIGYGCVAGRKEG